MKKTYLLLLLLSMHFVVFSQSENDRIEALKITLDSLQTEVPGLGRKVDFNVSNTSLPIFLTSIADSNKINVSLDASLNSILLSHSFTNTTVKNILLYLCKEHSLTIKPIGNILSIKKYAPVKLSQRRNIPINYDELNNKFSIDLNRDTLSVAFKKITDVTGKNLVYSPEIAGKMLSGYIQNKSFDSAIDKLAFANNLIVTKTKDGYYMFESVGANAQAGSVVNQKTKPRRYRSSNFYYKVKDTLQKTLEVDFENVQVGAIIKDIGYDLKIGTFTNVPLNNLGTASIKADQITYDNLLSKLLEDTAYRYKKEGNLYLFGKKEQASVRSIATIPLMFRSIEIMTAPMRNRNQFNHNASSTFGSGVNNNLNQNYNNRGNFNNQRQNINTRGNNNSFSDYNNKAEALVNILPAEILKDLEVKTDVERNSFIVSGDAQKVEKFRAFIKEIDKPVPVILIEVMILEVSKSATVDAGVELGLAEQPVSDKGKLFPSSDVTLGAATLNKIIGGFNGFGSENIGKLVPNFYAKISAMEANGNIKIRSTPKLATLNGHEALLSNGERSYYAITRRDIIGSQNPQTTEIKNYVPIDADLSIAIKPMVAGDNQITMSINVVQSSFNGKRIDDEAPPGINSREFTSIIRVKDQDVVILGGLEENLKNDSGSGVPVLSRIPVLKWLFSKRTRVDSKKKLSVLIKPTLYK